ncbi:MAG: hypothetical protein HZB55_22925 [Deltaproteobacteria bacterium]|nr:hypothetical protein [Deltaproteobacteria bacterium]
MTEVSDGGSVPELRFVSGTDRKILLLDGEELVGAKQNRVLNLSILVAPQQTVTIPVSCVEQGRWSARSAEFQTAGRAHFARGRAEKAVHVSQSLRTHGQRHSDQSQVWERIQEKADALHAHSATGAMADVFTRHAADLGAYERELRPLPDQVGAVFSVAGEVSGLDLFDAPSTLGKLWGKLVGSYALDALEAAAQGTAAEAPPRALAEGFLEAVRKANPESFPALGLGEDLRLEGPGVAGGALVEGGRVIHLGAFRLNGHRGPTRRPGMARASARRAQRL